ncbi:hypothetical protein IAR50_000653 [Cryptococcus sp. DSM 104548]
MNVFEATLRTPLPILHARQGHQMLNRLRPGVHIQLPRAPTGWPPKRHHETIGTDLRLEFGSPLLERDLAKFTQHGCQPPIRPQWPDMMSDENPYYRPLAGLFNSVLDIAREAHNTMPNANKGNCALYSLYSEDFRWTPWAVESHLVEPLEPDLVGFKLKDPAYFDESTQSVEKLVRRNTASSKATSSPVPRSRRPNH